MSDLIHADELLKEFEKWNADLQADSILYGLLTTERQLGVTDAIVIARQMPTVEAIPVKFIIKKSRKLIMSGQFDLALQLDSLIDDWMAERKEE